VLPCDLATGREYGVLKSRLKTQGTPLPENDTWIAAIAIRHGLAVVSRDQHFLEITELTVVKW
jgi:tRNA(fMet)-specific endonuclease VapC